MDELNAAQRTDLPRHMRVPVLKYIYIYLNVCIPIACIYLVQAIDSSKQTVHGYTFIQTYARMHVCICHTASASGA